VQNKVKGNYDWREILPIAIFIAHRRSKLSVLKTFVKKIYCQEINKERLARLNAKALKELKETSKGQ